MIRIFFTLAVLFFIVPALPGCGGGGDNSVVTGNDQAAAEAEEGDEEEEATVDLAEESAGAAGADSDEP